jgi:hypothetical protein
MPMKPQRKTPEPAAKPERDEDDRAARKRRHLNRKLDEALEDTFPGSDPVSISQPSPSAKDKNQI